MFSHFSTHPLNDLKRCRPSRRMRRGFTLPEMFVVIAIIALLAGILFSATRNMLASGKTAKATANLRQIGVLTASYTADNNNCLPVLIDWTNMGVSPDNPTQPYRFWQNLIRVQAGISIRQVANIHTDPWLPEMFYDPTVKKRSHPWGDFGVNDSIILGIGQLPPEKDCPTQFGQTRGTPLSAIGRLSQKVIVSSAMDGPGSSWGSSWYFQGDRYASEGQASIMPKPETRHGGKALCLFADGHAEALDVIKMDSAERRKYFLRD
jgi:prepilin-type N-terminal cleavage/methylation domain-containing protein/prepilin-type processing-associated H-X9-DG protein